MLNGVIATLRKKKSGEVGWLPHTIQLDKLKRRFIRVWGVGVCKIHPQRHSYKQNNDATTRFCTAQLRT